MTTTGLAAKAPAKIAAQVEDVVGDYEISYTIELEGGGSYAGEMTVSAGTSENSIVLNIPFENGGNVLTWNLVGTLNPSTGDITFSSNQASGFNGATVDFQHWNSTWQSISEIVASYTGSAIVFDQDDAMGLLASSGGYYTFFDTITMDKIIDDPNADPNEGWTSIGNAKFLDPWVMPGFNAENQEYEVELQQNDLNKDIYRLVDPYKGNFPMADYNTSTSKHGYIQFNISDPDHVYFDVVEAGFANSEMNLTKIYCYNLLTYFSMYFDVEPETIVEVFGEDMTYTTFKDGVINLGSGEYVDEETGETEVEYDACFGVQGEKDAGYGWTDKSGNLIPMIGYIAFPDTDGISVVNKDDSKLKVEYFDLYGRKINGPVEGQIVIRRQGSNVSKVLR